MARYRARERKLIDAVQWTGDNYDELEKWAGEDGASALMYRKHSSGLEVLTAHQKWAPVEEGAWVVREPSGNRFYPITDDIFHHTYESE